MMDQFADIEGPVRIGLLHLILIAAAVLAVLAAGFFILRTLVRKSRKALDAPSVPQRSPLERALERLKNLIQGPDNLSAEPFTVEVSDIVRDYLEEALKLPAREQTSEEFLGSIQSNEALPPVLHEHMPTFLELCDRVKFARQSLEEPQRQTLIETARIVIESTDRQIAATTAPTGKEAAFQ